MIQSLRNNPIRISVPPPPAPGSVKPDPVAPPNPFGDCVTLSREALTGCQRPQEPQGPRGPQQGEGVGRSGGSQRTTGPRRKKRRRIRRRRVHNSGKRKVRGRKIRRRRVRNQDTRNADGNRGQVKNPRRDQGGGNGYPKGPGQYTQ